MILDQLRILNSAFWQQGWFTVLAVVVIVSVFFLIVILRERSKIIIEREKSEVLRLNAEQYKSQLELERIINYFSVSLVDKITVDNILWDVADNLLSKLDFEDCIIYLWNYEKTKLIQRAGYGPKGSIEKIKKLLHINNILKQIQPMTDKSF